MTPPGVRRRLEAAKDSREEIKEKPEDSIGGGGSLTMMEKGIRVSQRILRGIAEAR